MRGVRRFSAPVRSRPARTRGVRAFGDARADGWQAASPHPIIGRGAVSLIARRPISNPESPRRCCRVLRRCPSG
ncbi:hypothetical protein [Lysobacter gummosus]|uniref:hypothetical protein n=1 Tax=Lysobacter gummosus TaxID=262324 RepID=UPI00362FC0DE